VSQSTIYIKSSLKKNFLKNLQQTIEFLYDGSKINNCCENILHQNKRSFNI
jgi:hypothetical protein